MIQVEPCTLPLGFVAWREGINEQWAECPWQAAAKAARSDPMSERVTTEQAKEMRLRLTKELAELPPAWPSTSAVLEEAEQMIERLVADRDEQAHRADVAECKRDKYRASYHTMQAQLAAANAEVGRLRGDLAEADEAVRELMMRLEQALEDTIAGAGPGRVWIDSNSGMSMGKAYLKRREAALAASEKTDTASGEVGHD